MATTPKKRSTALRCQPALLEKIDAYARSLLRRHGVSVTRSAAAEALLRLGLRAAEERHTTIAGLTPAALQQLLPTAMKSLAAKGGGK